MIELFGMDINILETLQYIVMIVLGGLSIWFKYSEKAQKKAKELAEYIGEITGQVCAFITEAEKLYESGMGEEKKEYVVNKLYELIPSTLITIITKDMIGEIVQASFDELQEFVTTTLDKVVDEIEIVETEAE